MNEDLVLGIDIGTSSVKTCIVRRSSEDVLSEFSSPSNATVKTEDSSGDEQSVEQIFSCIESCMNQLPEQLLTRVSCVAVCGQMHGCVLWQSDRITPVSTDHIKEATSNLITWQDGRCTEEFLRSLPCTTQPTKISTGYGCASLAWLHRNKLDLLNQFDTSGTIMDLLVCVLCGAGRPHMSTHNANSWGYFDLQAKQWELELLKKEGFPVEYLPKVVEAGTTVGHLAQSWYHVPKGTAVLAAMGDLQCSTLAVLPGPHDAVLNIGTSSQLAVVATEGSISIKDHPSLLQVPYFGGKNLIVAASLTGGNAVAQFVDQLEGWCSELGVPTPNKDSIYQHLFESAAKIHESSLCLDPLFWGERHFPSGRGSASNIHTNNGSLGDITHALCKGIIVNIKKMMPADIFHACKVDCIVGCGSALLRNELLQRYIREVFELKLQLRTSGISAAFGAALAAKSQN